MGLPAHFARRLRLALAALYLLSGAVAGGVAPWLPVVALPVLDLQAPLDVPVATAALLWVVVGAACLALPVRGRGAGAPAGRSSSPRSPGPLMRAVGMHRIRFGTDIPLPWNPSPRDGWRKTILRSP